MEGMKSVANGDGTTLKMDECCMLACFLRPGVISCDLAAALLADHPCTGCAYVCFCFHIVVFTIVQLILEFGFCIKTYMFCSVMYGAASIFVGTFQKSHQSPVLHTR